MNIQTFTCREVIVQFKNNRQGVRFMNTEVTGCNFFLIQQDPSRLTISYCDNQARVIKVCVYNFAEVVGFDCESMISVKSIEDQVA